MSHESESAVTLSSSNSTFKNENPAQKVESLSTKSTPVGKLVTAKAQESSYSTSEDEKPAKKVVQTSSKSALETRKQESESKNSAGTFVALQLNQLQ